MLAELNVRDIALIREAGVEFRPGLNILTGETGAGKSVIIGSALLSLGGKAKPGMVREGADSGYSELVFTVTDPDRAARLRELGLDVPEDGTLVISRKLTAGRSVSRINGETVSLPVLREAAALLIDVYSQNEYHSLYDSAGHLGILDAYLGSSAEKEREAVRAAYRVYTGCREKAGSFDLDESARIREMSLAEYEIGEIDRARPVPGEEEELAALYRKLSNAQNLAECLGAAQELLSESVLGAVIARIREAERYDSALSGIETELLDAQAILGDAEGEISSCLAELDLSGETLAQTEERLDLIRSLETKYGRDIPEVLNYREKKAARLAELNSYEENRALAERELAESRKKLENSCRALTAVRKEGAVRLCEGIRRELLDLGFENVCFEARFTEREPKADGMDSICFYAALNPGEALKPLNQVASGGELSRVMLSIKTVLAESDDIPTLIFDEIDAGISGRTAQKVAEKLDLIAKNHQVICITHLPQIASMADTHFVIRKTETEGRNVTTIGRLEEKESVTELARLLGGARITEAVLENAVEMKQLASAIKAAHRGK